MFVIITGIKSEKTRNAIAKSLSWLEPKVTGSKGNYQVRVDPCEGDNPIYALKAVYGEITNLTPDHLANLKWKVQK